MKSDYSGYEFNVYVYVVESSNVYNDNFMDIKMNVNENLKMDDGQKR